MIAVEHGEPARGLVLLTRLFRMTGGYGIMAPKGFIKVQRVEGPRWGLFISGKCVADELYLKLIGEDNMPTIQGPWLLSWLILMPNAIPLGSRKPIASLYISQTPYWGK